MSRLRSLLLRLDQFVCSRIDGGHAYSWTHGALTGQPRPVCLHCQHLQPRGQNGVHMERPTAATRRRYRPTTKEN